MFFQIDMGITHYFISIKTSPDLIKLYQPLQKQTLLFCTLHVSSSIPYFLLFSRFFFNELCNLLCYFSLFDNRYISFYDILDHIYSFSVSISLVLSVSGVFSAGVHFAVFSKDASDAFLLRGCH